MASRLKLNETQRSVLRWIADGSPAGVMRGYGHRISAAALRSHGLIKISGRSTTWRARLTSAGEAALGMEPEDDPTARIRSVAPVRLKASDRAASRSTERIALPHDLRGAHPLVTATREAAVGARPGADARLRIGPRRGVAYVEVSRPLLRRALLILHGLTRETLRRGCDVVPYPEDGNGGRRGIAIKVRGHPYPVEVHELTEQLPLTREEIIAWRRRTHIGADGYISDMPPPSLRRRRAIGRLRLVLPNGYYGGRSSWSDGPRGPIETKLPSVLRTLELRADADDRAAGERARHFAELQREQEMRDERARRELVESTRVDRLLAEVASWRRCEEIRAYVAALEKRLSMMDVEEQARIAEWCRWASHWADQTDPSRHPSLISGLDDA